MDLISGGFVPTRAFASATDTPIFRGKDSDGGGASGERLKLPSSGAAPAGSCDAQRAAGP